MKLIDSIFRPIVEWGIREELLHGDHTGQNLWEPGETATAQVYAKQHGIIAGLPVATMTWKLLDPACEVEVLAGDGDEVGPGDVLMRVTGEAWIFGAGERLALDYLQHLSGIATRAHHYVKMVEPYDCVITDARKGIPVIRYLQKYAVAVGGARSHMYSLHNAILIKDNHIKMAGGITAAVARLRPRMQHTLKIEVECETLDDVQEALDCGCECIMFDNMDLDVLRQAVALVGGRAYTVATGGVNESTVIEIAKTGVGHIAIGGIVHSGNVLDISIDIGGLKDSAKRDISRAKGAS
ncbi:MAG: carboxylating nicotinate-nucleotide diphosphorylase [Actinomycetota bacterium]|nr:carboxylating nicotinate-nucleotide diphosphorylase [Actinomycetota bacterium]